MNAKLPLILVTRGCRELELLNSYRFFSPSPCLHLVHSSSQPPVASTNQYVQAATHECFTYSFIVRVGDRNFTERTRPNFVKDPRTVWSELGEGCEHVCGKTHPTTFPSVYFFRRLQPFPVSQNAATARRFFEP